MQTIRAVAVAVALMGCMDQPAEQDRDQGLIQPRVCPFIQCSTSFECTTDPLGRCRFCNGSTCSDIIIAEPPGTQEGAISSQLSEP